MHLTNYSINKKNEGAYQANSDETVCQGHKWYEIITVLCLKVFFFSFFVCVYVFRGSCECFFCRSLKALWGYFKRININHIHVWETIKDLVVKAIIA